MNLLENKIESMRQAFLRMSDISNSNFRIMGRLLAITEVLKDKGMFTDEEVKAKFEELDKLREEKARAELEIERDRIIKEKEGKSDKDSGNPEGNPIQPKDSGNNEDSVGKPKLTIL